MDEMRTHTTSRTASSVDPETGSTLSSERRCSTTKSSTASPGSKSYEMHMKTLVSLSRPWQRPLKEHNDEFDWQAETLKKAAENAREERRTSALNRDRAITFSSTNRARYGFVGFRELFRNLNWRRLLTIAYPEASGSDEIIEESATEKKGWNFNWRRFRFASRGGESSSSPSGNNEISEAIADESGDKELTIEEREIIKEVLKTKLKG